ncbi:MAG: hypothetical protein SGCHY_004009, partial [Lobulomycetales sp.]
MLSVVVTVALPAFALGALTVPPQQPTRYPVIAPGTGVFITESFLEQALVLDGLAAVAETVPAATSGITQGNFVQGATVEYVAAPCERGSGRACPNPYCYWPYDLCVRNGENATTGVRADLSTCTGNQWGLSYDDGPIVNANGESDTPALIDALDAHGLKASFFVVGARVLENPDTLKKAFESGHEIGIHTWTHNPLTSMTNAQIVAELQFTAAIVYRTIGIIPKLIRPPYGDIDDRVRAIANALGYTVAFWTTRPSRDSQDAGLSVNPETNTAEVQQQIIDTVSGWFDDENGFISLQHDLNPWSVDVALRILANVETAGTRVKSRITTVGACNGITQDTAEEVANRTE